MLRGKAISAMSKQVDLPDEMRWHRRTDRHGVQAFVRRVREVVAPRGVALRDAQLPADALGLVNMPAESFDEIAICCDLERHVFYADHTDPMVAEALRASHWFDLREWASRSPGASST